jgi:glycosyltransferase involved in cell wall biosynthesis
LLDRLIVPERDLQDIDAVIISRGRDFNLRRVLDYCQRQSIATMYMIDDNWFWVGKDWPEPYASIFAPGLPQYEMFLSCLRECDAVLVYNDLLAEDVRPHARQIIRLPVNVRQADFQAPLKHAELKGKIDLLTQWRRQTDGLIAGYIGSLRYNDGAFAALAAAACRRQPPVKAVLFGVVSQQQRHIFGPEAVVLPYVGYDDYAAAIGALHPDILVAPLDSTRTSMSKCANKYLEYSIAGAAGVYSDTPPYSQTVVDGRTGLLVRGDDKASWSAAIGRLVEDAPLRKSIAAAAREDVLERFETGVVAPVFAQALLSLIRESGPKARYKTPELAAC